MIPNIKEIAKAVIQMCKKMGDVTLEQAFEFGAEWANSILHSGEELSFSWNRPTTKLPEPDTDVIVLSDHCNHCDCYIGYYDSIDKNWYVKNSNGDFIQATNPISYWSYIPKQS